MSTLSNAGLTVLSRPLNEYRISSNSSRPPNRPRPRIDRVHRLEASETQRALELST